MKNGLRAVLLLLALLTTGCVAISNMSHDAEAVVTGIREMERRGVRTLLLNIGSEAS
jgi:hypothetical protein